MRTLLLAAVLAVVPMTDDIYEQPEDAQPVTVTPSALLDAWGDPRFLDVDDPAQASAWDYQASSIGPAFSTFMTHGVVNADFMQGPPRPSDPIGDDNPLPGWRYVVEQGGGFEAYWVDDPFSTSGKAVRFLMTDPAEGDRAYVEQVVPVPPGFVAFPRFRWDPTASGRVVSVVRHYHALWVTPLAYDGTSLASESSIVLALSDGVLGDTSQWPVGLPAGSRYLRIRVGRWADVAPGAGTSISHLRSVALRRDVVTATFVTSQTTSFTATGATLLTVVSANANGTPAAAAERFVAPGEGYVQSIGVQLSKARTGGTLAFVARNLTTSTSIGPTATINSTDTETAYASADSTHVGSSHLFYRGNVLRVTATGSSFAPTTADAVAHVTIAYVPPEGA